MSQGDITPEPPLFTCEPITFITVCENVGYTNASFPNFRNQMTQVEANAELNNFLPLIRRGCSGAIVHFLCAVYAPFCVVPFPDSRIRPCKNLCELVRANCEDDLEAFDLMWPPHLECDLYPNRTENPLCFGPPDPSTLRIPPIDGEVTPTTGPMPTQPPSNDLCMLA